MIDEEHDRLVLCVLDGGQVKAAGAPANPPGSDDPVSTAGVPLAWELPTAVNTAGLALVAVKE
jgi:hypothetical protein